MFTCSAGRVLGEPGEGFDRREAGSNRFPSLVVDRVVDVSRSTSLDNR